MFTVRISSPHGVEADFHVPTASTALDLALRSQRAGLVWSAEVQADERSTRLPLPALQQLAADGARDDAERRWVDEIAWQHEVATRFALN